MQAFKYTIKVGDVLVRQRSTNECWPRDRTIKITSINGNTIHFIDMNTHVMDWYHASYTDTFDIKPQEYSLMVIDQVMCELMHDIDRMQLDLDEKKRKLAILQEATTIILHNGT